MEIVAHPRRKRDACYRQRMVNIVMMAPELAVLAMGEALQMASDTTGGRWPYRAVGPVKSISTSMNGHMGIRVDREWAEPAW